MKKKILLIIINKTFFDNYFKIFKFLNKKFDLKILINAKIKKYVINHKSFQKNKNLFQFYENKKNSVSINRLIWLLRWNKTHKNPDLKIFFKSSFPTLKNFINDKIINIKLKRIYYILLYVKLVFKFLKYNFVRNTFYFFISKDIILKLYIKFFNQKYSSKKFEYNKYLKKFKPDLVLFPNRLVEPDTFRILHDLKCFKNIKSFFIADKWDNLGSKTVFYHKPDFIGVWGEQALYFAKKNHKFLSKQIFQIGNIKVSEKIIKLNKNSFFKTKIKPQILYIGCHALENLEFNFLTKLNEFLVKENLPIKILYRIHPRANRIFIKRIHASHFKKIKIDGEYVYGNLYDNIKNSIMIFSTAITTTLMQTLLLKRPHYLFLDKKNKSFFSSYNHYCIADHCRDLDKLKGLKFFFNEEKFLNHLKKVYMFYKKKNKIEKVKKEKLNLFHIDNNKNFNNNLLISLNKILK